MSKTIALCAAAALLCGGACTKDRGAATTTTTGAGIVGNEDAVQRLSAQRCQREMECNRIGQGKSHEDYPACERTISGELRASLHVSECPYGISDDKLSACAKEIRNEKCTSQLDAVSRLATCRTGRLCVVR